MLICHAAKCKMLYCKLNVTGNVILIIRLTLHVRQRQFSHGWPVLWTISTDLFKRIKFAINRIKILHSVMHNTNVLYYDVNRNSTARATRLTKRHLCRIVTCQRSSSIIFISQNTYDYELRFLVKILDVFKMNPGLVQLSVQINECESENTILQHLHHGKLLFKLKALL